MCQPDPGEEDVEERRRRRRDSFDRGRYGSRKQITFMVAERVA